MRPLRKNWKQTLNQENWRSCYRMTERLSGKRNLLPLTMTSPCRVQYWYEHTGRRIYPVSCRPELSPEMEFVWPWRKSGPAPCFERGLLQLFPRNTYYLRPEFGTQTQSLVPSGFPSS